jgi:hypothetical protein
MHCAPPLEIKQGTLRAHLSPYGEIRTIQEEKWLNVYRYAVANGVGVAVMALTKHIPSYMTVVGHGVLVSYEGPRQTCFGCGEVGRLYQACPIRRTRGGRMEHSPKKKWVEVTATSLRPQGQMRANTRDDIPPGD